MHQKGEALSMHKTLLILAGGLGSRYGGLKQLEKFGPNNETLSDINISNALKFGFDKVVFVLREEIVSDFRQIFVQKWADKVKIEYVVQRMEDLPDGFKGRDVSHRVKPWGTGHAVWSARNIINEPFVMINADDFYDSDVFAKCADFIATHPDPREYAMVGYKLANTLSKNGSVNRGVCTVQDGRLVKIEEVFEISNQDGEIYGKSADGRSVKLDPDTVVSMNAFVFKPNVFEFLTRGIEDFLQDSFVDPKSELLVQTTIGEEVTKGKINMYVLPTSARWLGVTYKADSEDVRRELAKILGKQ